MMHAEAIREGRAHRIPAPAMHLAGKVAVGFLVFLGIGALAGGIMLVMRPDGSLMGFNTSLLAGSPFSDFLVPGIILGGLFGVGALVSAVAGLRRAWWAPATGFAIGCGQMIWIAVELLIIRELSFLHPLMFGTGLVIAAASASWGWPTLQGWMARR